MSKIPTIKVCMSGSGFCIINESDYDPLVHKKYVEPLPFTDAPNMRLELLNHYRLRGWHEIKELGEMFGVEKEDSSTWHDRLADILDAIAKDGALEDLYFDVIHNSGGDS